MRFATRLLLLTVILTFGVRQGGNRDADTLALELQTGSRDDGVGAGHSACLCASKARSQVLIAKCHHARE